MSAALLLLALAAACGRAPDPGLASTELRLADPELFALLTQRPKARGAGALAQAFGELAQGRTRRAIALLRPLKAELSAQPSSPERDRLLLQVRRQLAVAYLRLGEQENCLHGMREGFCTLPLSRDAVHARREGSLLAAAEYAELLELYPDDLESRWLLNLAHMTLGRYPQDVPKRWLIAPRAFRQAARWGSFPDRAAASGLGRSTNAGGVVADDFDGDGALDLVVSGRDLRFYRGDGKGSFTDRTEESGLAGRDGGLQLVHADVDDDGRLDVLVLRGAWKTRPHDSSLYRNAGGGRFEDVSRRSGLALRGNTQTAAFADYDNDGDLDLFLGFENMTGGRDPSRLYRNAGDGTFARDPSLSLTANVKGAAWGDYDDDGRPDLYVSVRGGPNVLYRNKGEAGFEDVTRKAGVALPSDGFAAWFFDYDNDGRLDLFAASHGQPHLAAVRFAERLLGRAPAPDSARLYRNKGDGTFEDVTRKAGLSDVFNVMGSSYGDLDDDGYPELFFGTGAPQYQALVPNRVYRNVEGRRFEEVTYAGGFGQLQKGHGASFVDLTGDGKADLVTVTGGPLPADSYRLGLYVNPGNPNHWLELRLTGSRSNRFGVGARVKAVVREGGRDRVVHADGSDPSFGAASVRRRIGLGRATAVRRLEVYWPASKTRQVFENLAADRAYELSESLGLAAGIPGR